MGDLDILSGIACVRSWVDVCFDPGDGLGKMEIVRHGMGVLNTLCEIAYA